MSASPEAVAAEVASERLPNWFLLQRAPRKLGEQQAKFNVRGVGAYEWLCDLRADVSSEFDHDMLRESIAEHRYWKKRHDGPGPCVLRKPGTFDEWHDVTGELTFLMDLHEWSEPLRVALGRKA